MSQALTTTATIFAGVAAVASLVVTYVASKNQNYQAKGASFFQLANLINQEGMRKNRSVVYGLNREEYNDWTEEERRAVDEWCACLDLAMTLYQNNLIDRDAYLFMYGDVTLRTVYQIVYYCNNEVQARGDQFIIPIRLAINDIIKRWDALSKIDMYPIQLTVSNESKAQITPQSFDGDKALKEFRTFANGKKF